MPKTTVKVVFEKETPGAVRYQEVDDAGNKITTSNAGCKIGTLYLRKSALGGQIPKSISVDLNT